MLVCNATFSRTLLVRFLPNCVKKIHLFTMPFYAVRKGRNPGVYKTWPECQAQVNNFQGPRFKKFPTEAEAWAFVHDRDLEKPFSNSPSKQNLFQSSSTSFPSQSTSSYSSAPSAAPMFNPQPPAQPVIVQPVVQQVVAPAESGPMRISSSRLLALKGTINNMKALADQFRQYVTQAEEQLEAIQRGKKRTVAEANNHTVDKNPGAKRQMPSSSLESNVASVGDTDYGEPCSPPLGVEPVSVYTDGCCHGNGRDGCRAGIGVYWGDQSPLNVSEKLQGRQTNNRAEIHAACKAIEQAKERGIQELIIHTDSQFTINGITKWIHKWKRNGWKLANGGVVINKDDFEELDNLLADKKVNVTWVHVDGHSGIHGNEEADRLANEGAQL